MADCAAFSRRIPGSQRTTPRLIGLFVYCLLHALNRPNLCNLPRDELMSTDPSVSLDALLKVRSDRISGIFQGVHRWSNLPIKFSRDPAGTNLYSIEETKRAYCRRFANFASVAGNLVHDRQELAACVIARAQIETVAMASFFVSELSRLIRAGNKEHFNAKVERFIIGSALKGAHQQPIHVNDALRHLKKLDEAYVKDLWIRYPALTQSLSQILLPEKPPVGAEDVVSTVSAIKNYDILSEVAHPNGMGVFFMFGQPEDEGVEQIQVRSLLANVIQAATWQGHHMLTALDAAANQADEYFCKFG